MDRGRPYKCDSPRVVKSAITATTDLVLKETTDYQNDNKNLNVSMHQHISWKVLTKA